MIGNRQRSLDRATSHIGLVVVESPPGFAADRFLELLVDRLDQPVELLDPDDVDGNAIAPSAILRAPLHAGLRGWRDTVVRRFEEQKQTVVVLPPGVSGDVLIDEPVPTALIDAAALRLSVPDIIELGTHSCGHGVIGAGIAELLGQLSDGWPAWLQACCDLITDQGLTTEELVASVGMPTFRRRVVGRTLREFSASDHYRLAQLAHFDQFNDGAAEAIGGAEFAFTVLPRAPGLYRVPSGQLCFVDPVRRELMADCALDPASAELLAPVLVAEGNLLGACHALLDAGLHNQAASMIERLPGNVIDTSDQRELLGVLRVLADQIGDHPGLALKQARIHGNLAEVAAGVESCELAIEVSLAHDPIRLEASVELLLYRHRTIDQEEAADRLAELRSDVGTTGPLSTRLREIEAQILGQSPDPHVVQMAANRFVEVASEWEYQQEPLRAAKALRGLAYGPLWHLGHYRDAQTRLGKAAHLSIRQTFDYGVTLTFKSFFDARCGDFASYRRASEQASLLVSESGLRWLEAYLYLGAAHEGAASGSSSTVKAATRTARELLGPLFETDSGVVFVAESVTLLAQVGEHEEAKRLLASLRHRRHQNPLEFDLAEIIALARCGATEAARACWHDLERGDALPNDRRWRIELELARADVVSDGATTVDLTHIHDDLERLGLSNLFDLLAPELELTGPRHQVIDVQLLGDLAVTDAMGTVLLPEGHVTELVKILGVHGGSATVDAVVDHLWPEIDLALGVRRLKNVLVKARHHLGSEAINRQPDRVEFGPHVHIDTSTFDKHFAEFRSNGRAKQPLAVVAAMAAMEIYHGTLLPLDLFSDTIVERRRDLERKAQEMIAFLDALGPEQRPSAAWLASVRRRVNAS